MKALKVNRYPGARPFAPDQQNLFFGREQAVRDLHNRLHIEQLLVLYSKSGLGKSSLLNAGLLPRVREEGKWEAVPIRFNAWMDGKSDTPTQIARDILLRGYDQPTFLPKIFPDDRSLWYAAKTRQINTPAGAPAGLLLLFDQFEELFTYSDDAVQQFGRQLAELLQTTVPQRVRRMVELFTRATPELLTHTEEDALERRLDIRIVLAIRSDRMSLLDRLSPHLPHILTQRYELQPLSATEARSAIEQPAADPSEVFLTLPFTYAPEALSTMLGYLTKGGAQSVESFQLQILCQSIEHYVSRSSDYYIEPQDVGDPELVFRDYYDTQIAEIEDPGEQLAARRLIEEGLVYEKERRRLTLFDVQINETYGVGDDLLRRLVNTHLLRAEPNLRGGYTYELSHDTLVAPVLKAKNKRLELEVAAAAAAAERMRQAERAAAEAARQAELASERRKRQRATRIAVIGFVLAAVSVVTSVLAIQQGAKAKAEEAKAIAAQKTAEKILLDLKQKQVEEYLKKADTHRLTGEKALELKMLQAALDVDSTRADVRKQIQEMD